MKLILGRSDASGEDLFLAFSLMMHTASRFLKTELTPRKVVHAGEDSFSNDFECYWTLETARATGRRIILIDNI